MREKRFEDNQQPLVVPGIDDNPRGVSATEEDKENDNVTKVVNLIWDENDPS